MEFLNDRNRPIDLLRYAGLFAWLCASVPLLLRFWYAEPLGTEQYMAWWILHLVFGFTYWNQVRSLPVRTSLPHRLLIVSVLTVSALGVCLVAQTSLGGILLADRGRAAALDTAGGDGAGLADWAKRASGAWCSAPSRKLRLTDAALTGGLFLGISGFAFMIGNGRAAQHAARDELRKVNSELRATQALLADNTRIAERVRIARELHDLVGHHLTALTLNLEVATHLVDGKALEHVQQAHSLAKLLLADVREVVSEMRLDDKVDLAAALRTLVDGTPEPRIHLDLPSELALTDPLRAQVLLRCAQEMITNSVRHAQARQPVDQPAA